MSSVRLDLAVLSLIFAALFAGYSACGQTFGSGALNGAEKSVQSDSTGASLNFNGFDLPEIEKPTREEIGSSWNEAKFSFELVYQAGTPEDFGFVSNMGMRAIYKLPIGLPLSFGLGIMPGGDRFMSAPLSFNNHSEHPIGDGTSEYVYYYDWYYSGDYIDEMRHEYPVAAPANGRVVAEAPSPDFSHAMEFSIHYSLANGSRLSLGVTPFRANADDWTGKRVVSAYVAEDMGSDLLDGTDFGYYDGFGYYDNYPSGPDEGLESISPVGTSGLAFSPYWSVATSLGYALPLTKAIALNMAAGMTFRQKENYTKYITDNLAYWTVLEDYGVVDETVIGGLREASEDDSFVKTPVFLRIGLGFHL